MGDMPRLVEALQQQAWGLFAARFFLRPWTSKIVEVVEMDICQTNFII